MARVAKEAKELKTKVVLIETKVARIEFTTPVLGTLPSDPNLYQSFIASKAKENGVPVDSDAEEAALPEPGPLTGFPRDENGLFSYDYQLKGFFKESGNVLKEQMGFTALRSKLDNFLFIEPRIIHFDPVRTEADGKLERPIRVSTPQGQRVAIASSEMLNPPVALTFRIKLLKHPEISWDVVDLILQYGAMKGYGQWRNGGFGKFTYSIQSE